MQMSTKSNINSILFIVILSFTTLISSKLIAHTITTNSFIVNSFCAGETVNISYVINGSFNPSNIFAVQLSDTNGDFISPTLYTYSYNGSTNEITFTFTGLGFAVEAEDEVAITGKFQEI